MLVHIHFSTFDRDTVYIMKYHKYSSFVRAIRDPCRDKAVHILWRKVRQSCIREFLLAHPGHDSMTIVVGTGPREENSPPAFLVSTRSKSTHNCGSIVRNAVAFRTKVLHVAQFITDVHFQVPTFKKHCMPMKIDGRGCKVMYQHTQMLSVFEGINNLRRRPSDRVSHHMPLCGLSQASPKTTHKSNFIQSN